MTPNTDTLDRLQELIDQGDLNTITISVNVTPKIYVPRKIGLTPHIPNAISTGIVNYEGQELVSESSDHKTYLVYRGTSNNTGSNYYLKEVKEPQPGEVYLVIDGAEITSSELNALSNYKLYLSSEEYCGWDELKLNGIERDRYTWDHYYEVCYEGGVQ